MRIIRILCIIFLNSIFINPVFATTDSTKTLTDGIGKYKSNGPIEITSDSLDVFQQEHKAIFTGHVIAVQGDVHIKSEKMTVLYKGKETSSDKIAKKENSIKTPVSEKNSIEKIIVEENILLTTPEETASGSYGIYDVVNRKVFLNNNVVLTRDQNILKGDRLVYDFATGKSEINSPESKDDADIGKTKQRVKALFVPDKNNNKELPFKKQ